MIRVLALVRDILLLPLRRLLVFVPTERAAWLAAALAPVALVIAATAPGEGEATSPEATASPRIGDPIPGRLLVRFRASASAAERRATASRKAAATRVEFFTMVRERKS